jgi:hypothetical protein
MSMLRRLKWLRFNVILEIFPAGKYGYEVVVGDGKPLFRDWRVVLESHRIDILLVVSS